MKKTIILSLILFVFLTKLYAQYKPVIYSKNGKTIISYSLDSLKIKTSGYWDFDKDVFHQKIFYKK